MSASSREDDPTTLPELEGWGRHPKVRAPEILAERLADPAREAGLTRGMGRSYGDASLPAGRRTALGTRLADRVLAFDPQSGVLRAEAGFLLKDLNRLFMPRGFASPVSPGTQFVTLGGMVAADVHGKNHHVAGCFGRHVRALRMQVADGRTLEVTEASEPELFRATQGGMGLTGHILEVELTLERIPSPWIVSERRRVADLGSLLRGLKEASAQWPFTAAWLDTTAKGSRLGIGTLLWGRWAEPHEAPDRFPTFRERLAVPFELPVSAVRPSTVRVFNALYYRTYPPALQRRVVAPWGFFYPLDGVRNWNRLYGRSGLAQYQCVFPAAAGTDPIRPFFETFGSLGGASPVTVVKDCGAQGSGMLSFPEDGLSAAIDIPIAVGDPQRIVDRLNEIVIAAGGRIYLAKDSLTRPEHFRAMEPRLASFDQVRRKWDPDGRLESRLGERLLRMVP